MVRLWLVVVHFGALLVAIVAYFAGYALWADTARMVIFTSLSLGLTLLLPDRKYLVLVRNIWWIIAVAALVLSPFILISFDLAMLIIIICLLVTMIVAVGLQPKSET